jgi:hypothetical protein
MLSYTVTVTPLETNQINQILQKAQQQLTNQILRCRCSQLLFKRHCKSCWPCHAHHLSAENYTQACI